MRPEEEEGVGLEVGGRLDREEEGSEEGSEGIEGRLVLL